MGAGWVPFSMAKREMENAGLISLEDTYGNEYAEIAVLADGLNPKKKSVDDFLENGAAQIVRRLIRILSPTWE